MSYLSALAQIGLEHRAEIEADLIAARAECEAAQAAVERATKRVHILEALLDVPGVSDRGENPEPPARKMTLHAAMHKVLRASPKGKMRASEIIGEIERLGLYRMKDGRLPESQQIHARAHHYPELFGKEGSFFYAK